MADGQEHYARHNAWRSSQEKAGIEQGGCSESGQLYSAAFAKALGHG